MRLHLFRNPLLPKQKVAGSSPVSRSSPSFTAKAGCCTASSALVDVPFLRR